LRSPFPLNPTAVMQASYSTWQISKRSSWCSSQSDMLRTHKTDKGFSRTCHVPRHPGNYTCRSIKPRV
jgi:hypothetical protein